MVSINFSGIKPKSKIFFSDPTLLLLLFSNILTIFLALFQSWSVFQIMFVYLCQSVIIGFFNFLKILSLKDFDVSGLKINGKPATKSTSTKNFLAFFFVLHFGLFHLVYFFIVGFNGLVEFLVNFYLIGFFILSLVIFFINHSFSFFYFKNKISTRLVNIGTLLFFPYARIIPMHICIILASTFDNYYLLIFFLILKTLADVIMHLIEHSGQMGE